MDATDCGERLSISRVVGEHKHLAFPDLEGYLLQRLMIWLVHPQQPFEGFSLVILHIPAPLDKASQRMAFASHEDVIDLLAVRGNDVHGDFACLVEQLSHKSFAAALEATLRGATGAMAVLDVA